MTRHENHGGQHWSASCPVCCPNGQLRMPIMRHGLFVPFALMDGATAMRNHGQSLRRLAERGGVNASEALAIIAGRPYQDRVDTEAVATLRRWMVSQGLPV